ncbi:sensor histidine kinase [Rurimicrobium arvi]|uniref:histidine kinase n=1 Tax=Rurimicrobium arvi TaxID=2049916 RepID=A0ABP8MWR3_9BACT
MKTTGILYLLLLGYIIAALSFWWVSLEKQSRIIYAQELSSLEASKYELRNKETYRQLRADIESEKSKRSKQYLGEGLTFLFVILVGSSVVFTTQRLSAKLGRQQNNFMLSVTHELKSPIAAIKLTLQTLQRHQLDEERKAKLLGKCIDEADRLNELCNNVLLASRVEGGQYAGQRSMEDISEVVQKAFLVYSGRYPDRFHLKSADADVRVETDASLLELVLNNLLENAIKYTPSSTPIELEIGATPQKVSICVKDRGNGIPDGEKKKIFDKFYRIGNEDTRKTKGTGLGLYLSKKIIRQLGGELLVKDNKPSGTVFEIQLPLN